MDAIDSVINQINDDNKNEVEICISDNCSTDNTKHIVEEYQKTSPINIVYSKNEKNMGADFNYLKVVEIAHGDFCWFLGSDDRIQKSGIDTVLNEIKKNQNISLIIVNRDCYDFEMNNKIKSHYDPAKKLNNKTIFSGEDEIKIFISSIFYYLGYITAEVINRKNWKSIVDNETNLSNYFNAYVHTYIITKMLITNPFAIFLSEHFVSWRSGNDSFMDSDDKKFIKRCLLDVIGYSQIASDVLKKWDNNVYYKSLASVSTTMIRAHLMGIKISNLNFREKFEIWTKIIQTYWWNSGFWWHSFPFIVIPKPLFLIARSLYKFIK